MPASLTNVSSALSVKLQTGTGPTGKATYSSFSFSRLNGTKSPDNYASFIAVITSLISIPVVDVTVINHKRLETN